MQRLVEEAAVGEEIINAKAERPVAHIVALPDSKPRRPGLLKGRFRIPDDFDAPLPDAVLRDFGIEP